MFESGWGIIGDGFTQANGEHIPPVEKPWTISFCSLGKKFLGTILPDHVKYYAFNVFFLLPKGVESAPDATI